MSVEGTSLNTTGARRPRFAGPTRFPTLSWVGSAAFVLMALAATGIRAQGSASSSLPTLTTAEQIRKLSPDEAVRRYPVRIRAVVTYWDPANVDYYVQDSTAGIYINEPDGKFRFSPGQVLEIEGETEEPDFAPQIGHPRYRVLGLAGLPQPKKVSLEALESTREDSQWVEVEGIVRAASPGLAFGSGVRSRCRAALRLTSPPAAVTCLSLFSIRLI